MKATKMTNKKMIRQEFWNFLKNDNPKLYKLGKLSKGQNEQVTDIRIVFCDYIEYLFDSGLITSEMAKKITL